MYVIYFQTFLVPAWHGDPHWVEIWFPLAHKSGIPEHLPLKSGGKQEPDDFPGGPFTILTLQPPFELQVVTHCAWPLLGLGLDPVSDPDPVPVSQSITSLQFWQFSGIPKHPPPKLRGKQEPWVRPEPPRVDMDWQPLFSKQLYLQSPFVTGPFPSDPELPSGFGVVALLLGGFGVDAILGGFGVVAKGQLISKCPYEKSVWTKYQRKYF